MSAPSDADRWVRFNQVMREFVWTRPAMCGSYGNPSFPPAIATATAQPYDEAERRHIHGLVYDFVDINSRVPKEHRKWKDGEV